MMTAGLFACLPTLLPSDQAKGSHGNEEMCDHLSTEIGQNAPVGDQPAEAVEVLSPWA